MIDERIKCFTIVERSDHVEATISLLEHYIKQLRAGVPPEDIGAQIALLGRIMARRV